MCLCLEVATVNSSTEQQNKGSGSFLKVVMILEYSLLIKENGRFWPPMFVFLMQYLVLLSAISSFAQFSHTRKKKKNCHYFTPFIPPHACVFLFCDFMSLIYKGITSFFWRIRQFGVALKTTKVILVI